MAPATIRRVWGSSALAAVIDNKLMPLWSMIRSWLVSDRTQGCTYRKIIAKSSNITSQEWKYFIIKWYLKCLPFIARLAIAPAVTLCIVSFSELLRSISKEVRPPASTIFSWFVSAHGWNYGMFVSLLTKSWVENKSYLSLNHMYRESLVQYRTKSYTISDLYQVEKEQYCTSISVQHHK